MTQQTFSAVDEYLTKTFAPFDPALEFALRASAESALPPIQVSPTQGKMLMILAQIQGAREILEIGTLGGYSTIWLARGLPAGQGHLTTLEADPKHADVAEKNIANAGLQDRVQLVRGRAIDTLTGKDVSRRAPYDLIFIDADKPSLPQYFQACLRVSRPGTLIIVDNVVRDGEVANTGTSDAGAKGVRAMNELIAAEKRVTATAIQTVGIKGYDGFALIRVIG